MLGNFSTAQVGALGTSQLQGLTTSQLNSITSDVLDAVDLTKLSSVQLRGLRATSIGNLSEQVKRGLRVLRSFANSVKVKYEGIEIGLDIDPEAGTADSGDLEADLSELLLAVAEAASSRNVAVALIIDEMQYLSEIELSALITAIHRINQKQLPVILIGAGLPQLVAHGDTEFTVPLFDQFMKRIMPNFKRHTA